MRRGSDGQDVFAVINERDFPKKNIAVLRITFVSETVPTGFIETSCVGVLVVFYYVIFAYNRCCLLLYSPRSVM